MFILKSEYKALVKSRDTWKNLCERSLALKFTDIVRYKNEN